MARERSSVRRLFFAIRFSLLSAFAYPAFSSFWLFPPLFFLMALAFPTLILSGPYSLQPLFFPALIPSGPYSLRPLFSLILILSGPYSLQPLPFPALTLPSPSAFHPSVPFLSFRYSAGALPVFLRNTSLKVRMLWKPLSRATWVIGRFVFSNRLTAALNR